MLSENGLPQFHQRMDKIHWISLSRQGCVLFQKKRKENVNVYWSLGLHFIGLGNSAEWNWMCSWRPIWHCTSFTFSFFTFTHFLCILLLFFYIFSCFPFLPFLFLLYFYTPPAFTPSLLFQVLSFSSHSVIFYQSQRSC